jgi:hypothetical protein
MSAKIIQFPKSPARTDEGHYFKTYYPLYLFTVSIWSASIFTLTYERRFSNFDHEFGVGFGIWLIGLLLLAEFTYILGVKRNQGLRKYQQEKWGGKLAQPLHWLIVKLGTYMIFFVTVALGAVATIALAGLLYARKHFN